MKKKRLEDIAVIYRSDEDGVWVAHSLRTDQIGTGDGVVDALADLLRAIDTVWEIARADKSVAFLREAPKDIQRLSKSAKRLPAEIYEVAHKLARGQWPAEIEPTFEVKRGSKKFFAEIKEPVPA